MINFFGIKLSWEELFIGAALQFPIYFMVGWWILLVMLICGLLWAMGGADGANKLFRRIGVPLVVTASIFFCGTSWKIFLAIPFMIWLVPSYGKESFLYKFYLKVADGDLRETDYLTMARRYTHLSSSQKSEKYAEFVSKI